MAKKGAVEMVLLLLVFVPGFLSAQVYQESNGLVVMEAERTSSPLGQWRADTAVAGHSGAGYLEFTGNNPLSGPATSPLRYTFKINQGGLYHLHLHCARETLVINGETRTDVANDCYVRVDGSFGAGPNPGNTLDLGGHNNKRVAVYDFQAGQTYTFVASGRSQRFKLNRIVFRHSSVTSDAAQSLARAESAIVPQGDSNLSGELKKWHKLTLSFAGPNTSETANPNPFLQYRLNVTFTHPASGKRYVVPGYYAADGDAANSSAGTGNIWRAHFSPDETGTWNYSASFRSGSNLAVSLAPNAGASAGFFDGDSGSFSVAPTDKSGRDFRAKGRLDYVGRHHLQFAETGEYFLKAGPDAPENLLAYNDFDATPNDRNGNGNLRKTWAPHAGDYNAAEAASFTWQSGKGSELLGALNYLASEELNAFSFLTFNVDGDDDNVFPHLLVNGTAGYEGVADNQRWNANPAVLHKTRFDVSKMAQWENIFEYAQRKGLYLHFKTQETENDQRMDGGNLGVQRQLYYRELIARFGHHLALNWNLGEENTNTDAQRKAFAQWFRDLDPYGHNIVLHTFPGQKDQVYTPMLGKASQLTGLSLQTSQTDFSGVFGDTLTWVRRSAEANRPWVVACDEPGDAQRALRPDNDAGNSQVDGRKNALWGNIMAGGAGVEFYFGYAHAHSDLTCQDFRSRDAFWDYCRHALAFFGDNQIPFQELANANNLVSGAGNNANRCLAKPGLAYVVQLPNGGTHSLNLGAEAALSFQVQWFNPRSGGGLVNGPVVTGGGTVSLGPPPNATNQDWIALVRIAEGGGNGAPQVNAGPDQSQAIGGNGSLSVVLEGQVSDDGKPEGGVLSHSWSVVSGPGNAVIGDPARLRTPVTVDQVGTYVFRLSANDGERTTTDERRLTVTSGASGTTVLTPVDDVYTENGGNRNNTELRVENSARQRISYLKFDASAVPGTYTAATLRLTEGTDVSSGSMTLRVHAGQANNWAEATITGANAPALGAELDALTDIITDGEVIAFDVLAHIGGPGVYTLILRADASPLDLGLSSSEGPNPPQLVLETSVAPPVATLRPADGALFAITETISPNATIRSPNGAIQSAELFLDGASLGTAAAPYQWPGSSMAEGTHRLTLVARDNAGLIASDQSTIRVVDLNGAQVGFTGPRLSAGGQLEFSWNGPGLVMESAPAVFGPWTSMPGGSPLRITPAAGQTRHFYRLKIDRP